MSKLTKELIRYRYLELLNERSLDKITVKDICQACEINRNTFYYYYKDIYDVLEDIFTLEREKVTATVTEETTVYDILSVSASLAVQYRKAIMHLAQSKNNEILVRYFMDVVQSIVRSLVLRREEGHRLSEEGLEYISNFYCYTIVGNFMSWLQEGLSEKHVELVRKISDTCELTIDVLIAQNLYR